MSPFNGVPTHQEQVALALIPKFAAALSIFGSGYITYDIILRRNKRNELTGGVRTPRSTYHRLMVGMSICDIMMSGGIFMSTWPMPRDVPNVAWNVGSTQTCTVQGFFEQFGVSTVMYSASLSIHYLISIRSGRFKSQTKMRKIEPYLHAVPLLFGLITAVTSLALKLFNYGLWDCWIAASPIGCEESWRNNGSTTCVRGNNASLYQWLFDLIPKWTSILIVTINMVLVYIHVRKQELLSLHWSERSSGLRSNANAVTVSQRSSLSTSEDGRNQSASTRRRSISFSKQIASQSYLYVGALWITWLPVIILRGVQLSSGVTYYWLLVWVALSIPMHGWWNLLVYLRPRFVQKRREQARKRIEDEAQSEREGLIEERSRATRAVRAAGRYASDFGSVAIQTLQQGDIVEVPPIQQPEDRQQNVADVELNNRAPEVAGNKHVSFSAKTLTSKAEVDNNSRFMEINESFAENLDERLQQNNVNAILGYSSREESCNSG